MQIQVKARQGHVNDSVRRYAEDKLGRLGRRVHDLTVVELVLSRERNPSIADDHTAEAIVHTKGPNIVVRAQALTWEAAIDRLIDRLERQIERQRDMRTHERRRRAAREQPAAPPELEVTESVAEIAAEEPAA
ncbi:MAG TPA: ribosome-associated translation inhibitor RaiA [Gaiellaceae bacterium]|nr:ribosome-associated translation inhibitor RaiA [Gaiellaceae bacterium]